MIRIRLMLNVLAISILCLLLHSIAHAQLPRTWVSGIGSDNNPCSRTAPCLTFTGALAKTQAGGEISVLDHGGYGTVVITKAITINGDGNLASVLAPNLDGITVNAGANDIVILRGLSFNGAGNGLSGVRFNSGKHLHVENCTFYDFPSGFGITSASPSGEMSIVNVAVTKCNIGIRVHTSTTITASISKAKIQSGWIGVDVLGGTATITDSIINHQTGYGLLSESGTVLNASGCTLSNNFTGVATYNYNGTGGTISIADCDIFDNSVGVDVAAGTGGFSAGIGLTFSNNRLAGNGLPVNGSLVVVGPR